MYLVRLIYASKVSNGMSAAQLEEIIEKACSRNEKRDLTGLLCCNSKFFLQCLEGSRESVNELYQVIQNDQRHHAITLLDYQDISTRTFTEWGMKLVTSMDTHSRLNLKYSGNSHFDPYEMTGQSCLGLMGEIANN